MIRIEGVKAEAFGLTQVQLENFKLIVYTQVSEKLAKDLAQTPEVELSQYVSWLSDALVVRVKQNILGERLGILEIKRPADWWEHFKLESAPRWFLKWFPVRYVVDTYRADALYPKLSLPEEEHNYRWRKDEDKSS